MHPLLTIAGEAFKAGEDNLEYFHNKLVKISNGALMYCTCGEADIIVDLKKYHIVPNTNIILLPATILSLTAASDDFHVHYFVFSEEMMKTACFRLEPAFMHFLKEVSCYTHTEPHPKKSILGLIYASAAIYADKENRFRESIAQNLLQIFFLNTYDKVQRYFTYGQIEGSNRKEQLFKKFIQLVRVHCVKQRDVAFYAEQLCISLRYLSAVVQQESDNSAKEIIDEFLIMEIKMTLQSTNMSLKEIAEYYRFPDQSFFGRYFKKHTGMSPKEYRARL